MIRSILALAFVVLMALVALGAATIEFDWSVFESTKEALPWAGQ